ncbi:hypothetical protein [Natronobiforma cellulositropha]|uniref:hypothetical protein n=1 Tax=Natronobiforma cellulositropha TaxID=1679076 RepID=UPI0021D5A1A7|nr:hypothetical protein [Natronobiforma cellulositropha]
MPADVLFALVLILALASTPALLFCLFWRGLVFLRDDALIDDLRFTHGIDPTVSFGIPFLPTRSGTDEEGPLISCPSCGTPAVVEYRSCPGCGDALES